MPLYKDTVLIVIFELNPLMCIKLEGETVYKSFRSYFEELWERNINFKERASAFEGLFNLLSSAEYINSIWKSTTLPFIFYPHTEEGFDDYRNLLKKDRAKSTAGEYDLEILKNFKKSWKKLKFKEVAGKESLDKSIKKVFDTRGSEGLKDFIKIIRKNIKDYNVEIRVLDSDLPWFVFCSHGKTVIISRPEEEVSGFSTEDKEIHKTFFNLFERYWETSEPIEDYLKKIEKQYFPHKMESKK